MALAPHRESEEWTVAPHYAPSDDERHRIAAMLLSDKPPAFETSGVNGGIRFSTLASPLLAPLSHLSECGDPRCGCNRLRFPDARRGFRQLVGTRMRQAVSRASGPPRPVRMVTLGSVIVMRLLSIAVGMCLTDFEILLDLWASGVPIDSFIAIDTAYTTSARSDYAAAMRQIATFFAPTTVITFADPRAFVRAAARQPLKYGAANCVLCCDAAAVPKETRADMAAAALLTDQCMFELTNHGAHGATAPLEARLPKELQLGLQMSVSSTTCYKRSMTLLNQKEHSNQHALRRVDDPLTDESSTAIRKEAMRTQAVEWLIHNTMQRAADANLPVYEVLYGPRMPIRQRPSTDAKLRGSMKKGSKVIVESVSNNGWVKLSHLDTYWGYTAFEPPDESKPAPEAWMLTSASLPLGQLMVEVEPLDPDLDFYL